MTRAGVTESLLMRDTKKSFKLNFSSLITVDKA